MCYAAAYHKQLQKKSTNPHKSILKQKNKGTCFYVINHYEYQIWGLMKDNRKTQSNFEILPYQENKVYVVQ